MFIAKGENVLITGATGCGKSFLACAMGRSACLLGYRTLYYSMNKFLESLAQARLDGTYLKWIRNFIDEPTLADAIMDRLAASAHRIALTGKSMRNKKNH